MGWFQDAAYNAAKKIFAKQMQEDESLKTKDLDVFGVEVRATHLLTYPPITMGILILKPEDIITRHKQILVKLERYSRLPPRQHDKSKPTFETLYYDVVINFINFVHLLPASEAHHHSEPGGLLEHSLQVSEKALKHVEQEILSPEYDIDIERGRKARWFYATWICGLLHDVCKVFTDIKVVDMASGGIWNPNKAGLVDWAKENNVRRYRVEYINGRQKNAHDSIKGSGALDYILTSAARQYLYDSPDDVVSEMRKAMVSYTSVQSYISNAVRAADAASTSKDMVTIWDKELGPKTAALYERIIKAMRILSKQWSCNTHGSKVQVVGGRVYLKYPDAFQDIGKFLSDEGVLAPSSTDAMVSVLDERNLIYRPEKQSKYVLIANGEFTPEQIIEDIKIENKSIKTGMYLPLEWPAMVYNKDPVPPSVVCYVKINMLHDYEIHKKNGEVEYCDFEQLCMIDDSIKPLLVDEKDTTPKKGGGGMLVDENTEQESITPQKKAATKKKATAKSSPKKEKPRPPEDKPVVDLQNTSGSGIRATSGVFSGVTDNQATDDQEKHVSASLVNKSKQSYPWVGDKRSADLADKEVLNIVEYYKQGVLSRESKKGFYRFEQGYVGITSHVLKELIEKSAKTEMKFFLQTCIDNDLLSLVVNQKSAATKCKVDGKIIPLVIFNLDISKFIIEQTGLKVDKLLPALGGRENEQS